ncbi:MULTISPECIES: class I SAM-dependent methyltransferase [Sulfitobacter]|uniref:Methyltransferase domain-containing protein n=1 Tax=Sulfitobacter delicatus TaxID=218672 RepID=A0A1G7WYN1_9RHOB|nr:MULTISPECIES: class I SAM-dependent methyltransferase [Sulfitobacter]SDG77039.1 Methyltransferase domain-containing protein [Sulfitobacter delicatus]
MRFYEKHILPGLTHLTMGQEQLLPYRRRAVSGAKGRVLEIGIGSGLNLALYPDAVDQIVGVDPSPELLHRAAQASQGLTPTTEMIEGVAEALPLENRSVDCVVATWTLCSVSEPEKVLAEIRRVLKPDGAFRFVEHGTAPNPVSSVGSAGSRLPGSIVPETVTLTARQTLWSSRTASAWSGSTPATRKVRNPLFSCMRGKLAFIEAA